MIVDLQAMKSNGPFFLKKKWTYRLPYSSRVHQFPGIEPFYGLGQLSSQQLEELYHTIKEPITDEQIQEGITGWKAYTSKNPLDLEVWISQCKRKLPYLKTALQSHLEYFPSFDSGLNEVEHLLFQYIADGIRSFPELFQYISQQRINDGLSDLHVATILSQLTPLLEWDAPLPSYRVPKSSARVKLTTLGLEVLRGKRDRFEFNRMDWWAGGVHLLDGRWRRKGQKIVRKKED